MANPNPVPQIMDTETGRFIAQLAADEYTPETVRKAAEGVKLFAGGMPIQEICRQLRCSTDTLYNVWCSDNPIYHPIVNAYARARKRRALAGADSAIDLAKDDSKDLYNDKPNNAAVQRSRLIVDTLYRNAAAMDPDTYGTKQQAVQVTLNVNDMLASARDRIAGRIIDND
jgi:hypothetical protein